MAGIDKTRMLKVGQPSAEYFKQGLVAIAPPETLKAVVTWLGAESVEQDCEAIYQVAKRLIAEIDRQNP